MPIFENKCFFLKRIKVASKCNITSTPLLKITRQPSFWRTFLMINRYTDNYFSDSLSIVTNVKSILKIKVPPL